MNIFKILKEISAHRTLPKQESIEQFVSRRTPGDKLLLWVLIVALVVSVFSVWIALRDKLTTVVPEDGGTLHEGIIGTPRFANPLLAISDADRDIVELTYAGLMTVSDTGELVPELAKSYSVSDDGLTYTFKIRDDATFQDGSPVTAQDVVFTIDKAKDPTLKSPERASWEGVTAEAVDTKTVEIHLKEPYAPFLENATLGILPSHIWDKLTTDEFPFTQFGVEPIGAGPYKVEKAKRDSSGIIKSITLVPFNDYVLGKPHIQKITLSFYTNTDDLIKAYENGDIESMHSVVPELKGDDKIIENPYSRIFGVFFNQNKNPALKRLAVREALNIAVDREKIIKESVSGFGTPTTSVLPPQLTTDEQKTYTFDADTIKKAVGILEDDGWKFDTTERVWKRGSGDDAETLKVTIRTSNATELAKAGEVIKESWEKIGVPTTLELFEPSDLQQNVIRPRDYEALLFGLVIGREPDLFAFWHSSQRNDPGLNIASYTDIKADSLLAKARTTQDKDEATKALKDFETEINKDVPAVFTHTPDFVYVVPKSLRGVPNIVMTVPSDRFTNVYEWYKKTQRVWPIFTKFTNNQ